MEEKLHKEKEMREEATEAAADCQERLYHPPASVTGKVPLGRVQGTKEEKKGQQHRSNKRGTYRESMLGLSYVY